MSSLRRQGNAKGRIGRRERSPMRPAGHSLFASSFFFGGYIFLLLLRVLGALRGSENLQGRIGLETDPALAYLRGSAPRDIEVRRSRRSPKNRRGGSGAWTLRTYLPPVQHPNHVASTGDVLWRRFMGRILWKTAHRRTSSVGITEWWNDGERGCLSPPNTPLFQYSTIPSFHPASPS
jgi:hypothetical protein